MVDLVVLVVVVVAAGVGQADEVVCVSVAVVGDAGVLADPADDPVDHADLAGIVQKQ